MPTVQDMIESLRDATGEAIDQLPNAKAIKYINKSFWELLGKFPFREKEKSVYFNTVVGTGTYQVPADLEALQHISITDLYDKRTPLVPLSEEVYDYAYTTDENARALPTGYIRESNCIKLLPIPGEIYRVTLRFWKTFAEFVADTGGLASTPGVPVEWHELVEMGAKWRRFADLRDYEGVAAWKQLQDNLILTTKPVEVKEKADHRLSGLEVIRRPY